ncbi:MBL fold metallo-hydrolase [Prevotella sp. KH2C16]|uniref:MBL fold metallo-hydrolase n=1 Tax=Prevotella sp. KH2C16 TaxID=1855325 RepID=UPI0008E763E7|nr:MBL fold metallo-hydrolase [Prevotella sp. KH2C16]SFG20703.1 phosphoribosyl 1,2-cyclic phosphate phosphodiesterase [Prevotella sp. KH2C16]
MTLTFLGTGTSGGVPALGCQCEVCRSKNPKDKRLRSAALLESGNTRVLIDCGPDIRQQLMPLPFKPIDGVLVTHIHYDHVAGMDDLRPFCVFGDIHVYANKATEHGLRHTMPYCFTEELYPGVPRLELHVIAPHRSFAIGDLEIMPIQVMHDRLPILGFRVGNFAYITDMKTIGETEMPYLEGVDTLVLNALRWEREHHSHMLVGEAIEFARRVGAESTYFTHMTHEIGFHDDANRQLPVGFQFAYDGLKVNL